jgi:hypothetical protein
VFIEVGKRARRDSADKLYKSRDSKWTFEQYIKERWGWTRQRAYQMIEAADVAEKVSTPVDIPEPVNEAQTRQLSRAGDAPLLPEPSSGARSVERPVAAGCPFPIMVGTAANRL